MSDPFPPPNRPVPIGRALLIPPGLAYDALRDVVQAIGRVHFDGRLPPIPIVWAEGIAPAAALRVDGRDRPVSLMVRPSATRHRLATVHEIGHLLDLAGIGAPGANASAADPLLSGWRRAVGRSGAFRALRRLAHAPNGVPGTTEGGTPPRSPSRRLVAYLLDPPELWARSYAQYVATASGHPLLLDDLDAERRSFGDAVSYPYQWEDVDFSPIHAAIDELFRGMGWR